MSRANSLDNARSISLGAILDPRQLAMNTNAKLAKGHFPKPCFGPLDLR